jgi:hypothetical protein
VGHGFDLVRHAAGPDPAFRTFEIADALIDRHGYPQLTPALKAKVFGLNGARAYGVDPATVRKKAETDGIARRKRAALTQPSFETYGPKTLREFRALQAARGGWPA